ncbi:MAG: DUF4249 domain-containing protein [Spirosomaceae bacterium]|jgi:hypothetical protein|nr:DUF4249 domain-containing protein [Spirosomataceae bacterium]
MKSKIFSLLCVVGLYGCVEEYDVRYQLNTDVLTVEGFVIDQPGTTVRIGISRNVETSSFTQPLKGCKVEIVSDKGQTIALTEPVAGVYAAPTSFRGTPGTSYQLRFTTPDGKTYRSDQEKMMTVPDIKKVYQEFDKNGLLDAAGKRVIGSTVNIYADFDDPAAEENYYLWRWQSYESQNICITCEGGQLNFTGGTCQRINSRNPPTYDYQCTSACWEIFYNPDINIFSDKFSNGRSVVGRLMGKIPYYSYSGGLIQIEQIGLSKNAFFYYQILRDQTQTTGTLTDTPPAPIVGNIQNTADPGEEVVGYFGAASSRKVNYWIDRSIYKDAILVPILGRAEQLEPTTPFRPPTYPCVPSQFRTPVRPEGWR